MKTYIGISRDHSISMRPITKAAARDYNECISSIKDAALREEQETYVSVVECGAGSTNMCRIVERDKYIDQVSMIPENEYIANGTGTPLFDSVHYLISLYERYHDKAPDVTFLIMVITDGQENASRYFNIL